MIQFILRKHQIFAPVAMGDIQTYAFLDTGASRTTLSARCSDSLEKLGSLSEFGVFGTFHEETTFIPQIEFAGEPYVDLKASVTSSMPWLDDAIPFQVDAALGSDVLLAKPLVLDFIEAQVGYTTEIPDKVSVEFEACFWNSLPFIKVGWRGRRIEAVLDTGAGMSIVNSAHAKELELTAAPAYSIKAEDVSGIVAETDVYRDSSLQIDEIDIGEGSFLSIDLATIEQLYDHRIDMIIGVNLLVRLNRIWILDKESGRIVLSDKPLNQ